MLEADKEWIATVTEGLPSVYDIWHGREVVVMSGPFVGLRGIAGGPYKDKIEVLFPSILGPQAIWMRLSMLSLVREEANQSES